MKKLLSLITPNKRPYYNRYVKIDLLDKTHRKEAIALFDAQDVIGNYAKAHNCQVTFEEASANCANASGATNSPISILGKDNKNKITSEMLFKYNPDGNKPFLRGIYEKLQSMIEGIPLRIHEHKQDTMKKLIKAGKVK